MHILKVNPNLKQCSIHYVGMFYEFLIKTENYEKNINLLDRMIDDYKDVCCSDKLFIFKNTENGYIKLDFDIDLCKGLVEEYVISDDIFTSMDFNYKINGKYIKSNISEDILVDFNNWFYKTIKVRHIIIHDRIKIDLYALCYYLMFTTEETQDAINRCNKFLMNDLIEFNSSSSSEISTFEQFNVDCITTNLENFVIDIYEMYISNKKL